jgi:hypothetical protein
VWTYFHQHFFSDPASIFKTLQETAGSIGYLKRPFLSILKSLVGLPLDAERGYFGPYKFVTDCRARLWVLGDKLLQQVAFQKESFQVADNGSSGTCFIDELSQAIGFG